MFGKILIGCLTITFFPFGLLADDARRYRTPEERREAGVHHQITDWLEISSLAEMESEYEQPERRDGVKLPTVRESSQTFQFGVNAELTENLATEIILEYELNPGHGKIDEAIIEYETDQWSMKVGREEIGFGEHFSHFATGPLLEFGETRADAITLGYKPSQHLELFTFVFNGNIDKNDQANGELNIGGGLEWISEEEGLTLGISYLSDLAVTDALFLSEQETPAQKQAGALSAYVLLVFEQHEITGEIVTALEKFDQLDPEIDQPMAWNLELAWMPAPKWQLAFRIEGSSELDDAPKRQYGVGSSWLIGGNTHLSIDYLRGEYPHGLVEDDDENELKSTQSFAIQLSVGF